MLLRLPALLISAWLFAVTGGSAVLADQPREIVVLETMHLPYLQDTTAAFRKALATLGHGEGEDVRFTVLNADGQGEQAERLLAETLAERRPALVLSVATLASRASRKLLKESGIPQVFAVVADPVGEGFVASIGARSNSNITGVTHVIPAAAKLEVVAQSLTRNGSNMPVTLGLLRSTYPSATSEARQLLAQVQRFPQIRFKEMVFDYVAGDSGRKTMRDAALALVREQSDKLDGLWLPVGPNELDPDYVAALLAGTVPVVYSGNAKLVPDGVMLSMISDAEINGRTAAALADAVLRGAPAGSIPVTRPDAFTVSLNVATATRLGAVVPSHILELAAGNIHH